jgi:Putative capsular polysaccharide synthesis protein
MTTKEGARLILRRVLRRAFGERRYRLAATVFYALRSRRRLKREHREAVRRCVESDSPPVIVYQMAKVGSSTVTWALRDAGIPNVFQVHLMHPDNIRRFRTKLLKLGWVRFRTNVDFNGGFLYKDIIEPGRKAKIITLAREPIGRNASFYFQNLHALWHAHDAHESVELSRLLSGFRDKFDHRSCLNWFDYEFKPVMGVDVYEHEFPHDAGHVRIKTDRYDILVMRSDLADSSKKRCIEEFLGVEGLSLAPKNVGSQKPYAAAYRKFLDALELPEAYVNDMLDSKYTRHFFSPDEITSLRAKWLRGNGAGNQPS